MNLQTAFRTAQSSLASNAMQTATLSRNVSSADVKGYARRIALVETGAPGSPGVTRVARATDNALQVASLDANAASQESSAVAKSLDALQTIVGDPADGRSPSAAIAALKSSLLTAAASPQEASGLASVVQQATTVAAKLRDATLTVQAVRTQADNDMATSVATINKLLVDFGSANEAIVSANGSRTDAADAYDRRDAILDDLSKELAISTVSGSNGELSIYTDTGIALFQGGPREVSMQPTAEYAAGVVGQAVYIDGVPTTGPNAAMRLGGGALAGYAKVRDDIAVKYQAQLDEVANGLVSAFSEQSKSGATPARAGLFTWQGGPSLPAGATPGIAQSIAVDPVAANDPSLVRDGGLGGTDYASNASGSTSYSSRLYLLADALDAPKNFTAPDLQAHIGVAGLAGQSEAWLEAARQDAAGKAADASAVLTQSTAALSNSVGVNIDDQMSRMLDLENSYQASAKMMATIDSMYAALFNAVQSLAR